MSLLKRSLSKISGRYFVQKILQKNIQSSQYLMGIGSGSEVFSSGENVIFQVLRSRGLRRAYCIFDVGSNQGQFLELILANIATDEFQIHCFEPAAETFKILNQKARKDVRIKLNNVGIGKEKATSTLHYDRAGSEIASLTKRKLDHFGVDFDKSETVAVDSIDSYCEENKIETIDLLKLDIEGHELDALEGATKMFNRGSISIVTFEFGGCNIDTRTFFQQFWYFFLKFKMKIYRITPGGYLFPIESYKEIDEQFRTTNFIALREPITTSD